MPNKRSKYPATPRKMKLPFPFKSKESPATATSSPWPWPTCTNPKTVSFRATDVLKTMNSAYAAPESEVDEEEEEEAALETVIRGLRSERLFFEPGETSSILEEAKAESSESPFKESVAMAVDSRDPFVDFRASMEEMVVAHGIKDWGALEELLTCYLKVNGESNHGYIVGAFVDLLVTLATRNTDPSSAADQPPPCSASSMTHSFTSPFSFSSGTTSSSTVSPSLSLVEVDDETEKSSVSSSSNISIVPLIN